MNLEQLAKGGDSKEKQEMIQQLEEDSDEPMDKDE